MSDGWGRERRPETSTMEIEYDAAKNALNIDDRGLSFDLAAELMGNLIGEIEDRRVAYGERRMIAYGLANGRLLCCVYTLRAGTLRVISLRAANRKEQATWLS